VKKYWHNTNETVMVAWIREAMLSGRASGLLHLTKTHAADVIPMAWTSSELSRDCAGVSLSTSTARGNATTPPPSGVDPVSRQFSNLAYTLWSPATSAGFDVGVPTAWHAWHRTSHGRAVVTFHSFISIMVDSWTTMARLSVRSVRQSQAKKKWEWGQG
jgi:hypothetical protein